MSSEPTSNGIDPSTQTPYQQILKSLLSHPAGHIFLSLPTSPHKLLIPQSSSSTHETSTPPTISSLSLHPTLESLLHILNADLPSAHFLCRHAEVAPKWESMYVHGMLHRVEGDIDNARAWYGNVRGREVFRWVWGGVEHGDEVEGKGDREVPEVAGEGWKHFLDRVERYRDRSVRRQKMRRRSESENVSRRESSGENEDDVDHITSASVTATSTSTSTSTSTNSPPIPASQITDWTAEAEALRATSLWEIMRVIRFCERKFGTGVVADARGEFLGRVESGDLRLQKIAEGMITGGEGWREF